MLAQSAEQLAVNQCALGSSPRQSAKVALDGEISGEERRNREICG